MRDLCRGVIILMMTTIIITGCLQKRAIIIKSTDGILYDFNKLKSNAVVLIYSYECGYCLTGIPKYNKLKEGLSEIKDLNFVAFAEQSLEQSVKDYPDNLTLLKQDLNWTKFVGYDSIYTKFWKRNVFPEFIYFKDGKRRKILSAPYDDELLYFKQYIINMNK